MVFFISHLNILETSLHLIYPTFLCIDFAFKHEMKMRMIEEIEQKRSCQTNAGLSLLQLELLPSFCYRKIYT